VNGLYHCGNTNTKNGQNEWALIACNAHHTSQFTSHYCRVKRPRPPAPPNNKPHLKKLLRNAGVEKGKGFCGAEQEVVRAVFQHIVLVIGQNATQVRVQRSQLLACTQTHASADTRHYTTLHSPTINAGEFDGGAAHIQHTIVARLAVGVAEPHPRLVLPAFGLEHADAMARR
jgi:hypothetical protein